MARRQLLVLVLALLVSLTASGCLGSSQSSQTPQVSSDTGSEQQLLNRIDALEQENAALRSQLDQLNLSVRSYEDQLAFYRAQFGDTVAVSPGADVPAFRGTASLDAPAVMHRQVTEQDGPFLRERIEQVGTLINVTVEIVPGRGRILVNTTPLMGEVFQDAANTAAYVAQAKTGRNLSSSDVIVSIVAEDEIPAVDGGSARALMTMLMISAIDGTDPRSDLTLTGTIDQDGRVGAIGGVIDKATAAKEKGKALFLLPRENSQLVRYTERSRDYYGYTVIQRVPERVDAKEYIESELGIRVEYVDTIEDVLRLSR